MGHTLCPIQELAREVLGGPAGGAEDRPLAPWSRPPQTPTVPQNMEAPKRAVYMDSSLPKVLGASMSGVQEPSPS